MKKQHKSTVRQHMIFSLSLFFSIFLFAPKLQAQIKCSALSDIAYEHPNETNRGSQSRTSACTDPITFADDYDSVEPFVVYLNFHLRPAEGEQISDPDLAIDMVYDILNKAHQVLGGLDRVNVSGPDDILPVKVPDTKYRYEIYHDTDNTNDLNNGIWLYPEQACFSGAYNHRVVDVFIGGTDGCSTGGSNPGQDVYLNGSLEGCFISPFQNGDSNELWARAKLLNHEIGHSLNLDHVAWCENQCNTVDIDPEKECLSNFPDEALCDGKNPIFIGNDRLCTWGGVSGNNNMMQQGTALNAITPCQWETVFNFVANSCSPKYSWCSEDCQASPLQTVFNNGDNVIWEGEDQTYTESIIINNGATLTINNETTSLNNIIVETGGELYINELLIMGPGRKIFVKRGAKLIVDGGKITSGTHTCESTWKGIIVHGNANKAQPDFPFDNLAPDDAGVVVLKNGATLMHASTAISTTAPGYSWPEQQARWGGLIHATDSYFINNKRAVEFMLYNQFDNKSVFDDCVFVEEGDYKEETIGVTIWECKGITFTRNIFKDLDLSGILGIDYGAKVHDGNQFKFMDRGIESLSTYPTGYNLEIGDESTLPNEFSDNRIHVLAESSDKGNKLIITNNNFSKASEIGVFITGDSRFEVVANSFADMNNGIEARNTGEALNFVNCNVFNNVIWGIQFREDNSGSRFLHNTFEYAWSRDVSISGSIYPYQGNPGKPAHNCFYDYNSRDISSTASFKYYHDSNEQYCGEGVPFHNVPIGSPTFTLHPTNPTGEDNHCSTTLTPIEPPSDDELEGLRNLLASRFDSWQNDLDNSEKELAYYDTYEAKTETLGWMLSHAMKQGAYSQAESYLEGETSEKSQKWKYGLKVLQKDYTNAQVLLNNFPTNTQEQQWYKQVQQINLDRLSATTQYTLSSEDETFLHTVANTYDDAGSHARSLLVLLTDARFDPVFTNIEEAEQRSDKTNGVSNHFLLAPNPANDKVALTYIPKELESNSRIRITNMAGNVVVDELLDNSGNYHINTSNYSPGIYFLLITNGKQKVFFEKLVIIH